MNTIFEQVSGRYVQYGDYLIPDLIPQKKNTGPSESMDGCG